MPGQKENEPLKVFTAASLHDRKPKKMEWLMDGWMPMGQTTAFYGDGGVGKTMVIQQLMTCVSTGSSFMGKATRKGRVMGLFCEDDVDQLARRQRDINTLYGSDLRAQENIYFFSRPAQDNVIMEFDKNSNKCRLTEIWHQLRAEVKRIRPVMLVIDTAADTFGGIEIDRQHVRRYIQSALTSIAQEFDLSVVVLAHPSAAGLANKTGSGGSTAWHNSVRCRIFMYKDEDKGCCTIKLVKNNYGPAGEEIDVYHNSLAFIPWNPKEMNGFSAQLKEQENEKWVIEKIDECWEKKINISFHPRANFVARQLLRMAKIDRYSITKMEIEKITHDLHKKGALQIEERGHGKSNGSTIRNLGC